MSINYEVPGPEWPEFPVRFDLEVRDSDDRDGTGGVRPRPGHQRPPSPALGEVGWQIAGLEKLELCDIEFAILAANRGHWRAAEILAEMLQLKLLRPTSLAFRAAAIMLAIRRSRLYPVERFWRLRPGEEILLVEEDHPTRARKRNVAYLPFAMPGEKMAWRIVPENLKGSPASLIPWNWTWIAYLFGYLIPAAQLNAEALREIAPTRALSLDAELGFDPEGDGPESLHQRVSSVANTPARAFWNIERNAIDKGLSQTDRALYIIFHEYDRQLRSVGGHRRDTLRRPISRMRERAREIRARGHGFEAALETLEEIQGFNPLELPRRPGDPLHSQAWERGAQALRSSSVDLDAPKMRSGKPVHPLLKWSELKGVQKELAVALRGSGNSDYGDEGATRPWAGAPRPPAVRPDYKRGLDVLDPHFHLDTCPCRGREWVGGGMCWAYHKMMCPSSPTVEQGVFFDGAYRPCACACGSTEWVRDDECWECRQRKEADMSVVALLEEARREARQDREERREFETALLAEVRDLYRVWMVAFWGRPPSQEAEDILAQEGEVEAS